MKSIYLVIYLLFSITGLQAQTKITGIVKDAVTKLPVSGASVYVPQTTNGVSSDQNGLFTIWLKDNDAIIVSFMGYESVMAPVALLTKDESLNVIYLKTEVSELNEVIVRKRKKMNRKNWQQYYDMFQTEFLGNSKIARQAKILNPEVLYFSISDDSLKIVANADAPLQIYNEKLGYQIRYELVRFECPRGHVPGVYGTTSTAVIHFGYPYFTDIVNEKKLNPKVVERNRLDVYRGSFMHFVRACYYNTLNSEGFTVRKMFLKSNPKYPGADSIPYYMKQYRETRDLKYLRAVKEPFITVIEPNSSRRESFITEEPNRKSIAFDDYLNITYTREKEEDNYIGARNRNPTFQTSQLKLAEGALEIYHNGQIADPEAIIIFGYMGWKKAGDMLPFDYGLDMEVTK